MTLADHVGQFIDQARAYQQRHGTRALDHALRRLERAAAELDGDGPPAGSLAQVLTFNASRRRQERATAPSRPEAVRRETGV
ncbi:hypothetical protein [Rubellimicrobium aerolatum]|uniref:Uncharacterized protein n=1 Tax=Rubellimicrobium aerolatum TaxID=490979 RepID=A0ABW0SFJ3_9RHOB|nr:hypothetical protein [Rubellimicrobium aerolatum]MBP1807282.1 hypothetical protein [Rubellimicrobium aerolatum]